VAPAASRPASRGRARLDERPRPPWHPVPVGELAVLVGLVLIVMGFLGDGERARTALVAGVLLASLAGLEQAVREHFAGFRSHTTLLAGACGLALGVAVTLVAPYAAGVGVAVVAFALAFWRLRAAFRARAGVGFRA
jgi:hypothetical protein